MSNLLNGRVAGGHHFPTFPLRDLPALRLATPQNLTTPLSRDNWWRRNMEPQLRKLGLEWANFQVMRRTHASLARRAGIDPKVVADQLGHALGVNLDVYTKSNLAQRVEAVKKLELAVAAA